jgi:hypothetical protein
VDDSTSPTGSPTYKPHVLSGEFVARRELLRTASRRTPRGVRPPLPEEDVIRRYLEALSQTQTRRGRPPAVRRIRTQLRRVQRQIAESDGTIREELLHTEAELEHQLAGVLASLDLARLEDSFVDVARTYSNRTGISYAAWRLVGVEARVLRRAGLSRSGS